MTRIKQEEQAVVVFTDTCSRIRGCLLFSYRNNSDRYHGDSWCNQGGRWPWPVAVLSVIGRLLFHSLSDFLSQLADTLHRFNVETLVLIGYAVMRFKTLKRGRWSQILLLSSDGFKQFIDSPTRGRCCPDHSFYKSRKHIQAMADDVIE